MKLKKGIITGIIIVVIAIVAIVSVLFGMGVFKKFDAQGYVSAILDQSFKGDVKGMANVVEGKTEKELIQQYEEGVKAFVTKNITTGIELDEELEAKYIDLCKEIFASMKYEVKSAEKQENGEIIVSVEYKATDVFSRFTALLAEESAAMTEKVEKGEYQGTVDEINAQMQNDFLNNSYELLKKAHEEAQYGEKETMKFAVKKIENKLYTMDDSQIYEFRVKILGLDAKED